MKVSFTKPIIPMALITLLVMLPQLGEAIYSPAITLIMSKFQVSAYQAGMTLSLFFIGFSAGVVFWGVLSDSIGRRPAVISGLLMFTLFSGFSVVVDSFELLLICRVGAAFSLAVCSVVLQSMLRDCFEGQDLARCFATIGIGIAVSPAVGMLLGGFLTSHLGLSSVFVSLTIAGGVGLIWACWKLPETYLINVKGSHSKNVSNKGGGLICAIKIVLCDPKVRASAIMVALINIMVFNFYSIAPVKFESLGLNSSQYGLVGLLLSSGSLLGGVLNRFLLKKHCQAEFIAKTVFLITFAASLMLQVCDDTVFLVFPYFLIMVAHAFSVNILSLALVDYKNKIGSLSSLFGFSYYLMLAAGLLLFNFVESLTLTTLMCSLIGLLCSSKRYSGGVVLKAPLEWLNDFLKRKLRLDLWMLLHALIALLMVNMVVVGEALENLVYHSTMGILVISLVLIKCFWMASNPVAFRRVRRGISWRRPMTTKVILFGLSVVLSLSGMMLAYFRGLPLEVLGVQLWGAVIDPFTQEYLLRNVVGEEVASFVHGLSIVVFMIVVCLHIFAYFKHIYRKKQRLQQVA